MKRPASLVVSILFMLMAMGQLVRFLLGTTITVDGVAIPLWISPVAAVIFVAIAIWLLRERTT